jgi:hypothetical protein
MTRTHVSTAIWGWLQAAGIDLRKQASQHCIHKGGLVEAVGTGDEAGKGVSSCHSPFPDPKIPGKDPAVLLAHGEWLMVDIQLFKNFIR